MPLRPFRRDQGWLLPPSLDEMLPQDHPARFVDAVLESLSAEKWDELGMDMEGDLRELRPATPVRCWASGYTAS